MFLLELNHLISSVTILSVAVIEQSNLDGERPHLEKPSRFSDVIAVTLGLQNGRARGDTFFEFSLAEVAQCHKK